VLRPEFESRTVRSRGSSPWLHLWIASAISLVLFAHESVARAESLPVVRGHQKISMIDGGFSAELPTRSGFGFALTALGEIDANDRAPVMAVSTHLVDVGAPKAGGFWVFELEGSGKVRQELEIASGRGGFGPLLEEEDAFGWSLAGLGDLDGSGRTAVAVGAPWDDDGDTNAGAIYILFLNSDGSVQRQRKISPRPLWATRAPWRWLIPRRAQGGFLAAVPAGENFGVSIAHLGDLDGDGVADLAVGSRGDNEEGETRGSVWILFLRPDGSVKDYRRIGASAGGFDEELAPNDSFGFSLETVGDLDGDGIAELAVGAYWDSRGCPMCGAVWILFLNRDGTVRRGQRISVADGGFGDQLNNGAEFGVALAAGGDLDGDGIPDLAVGARGESKAGPTIGAVWLLALHPNGTVKSERKISLGQGGFTGKLDPFDRFGAGLAFIGDLDGDGFPELAVGAESDDDGKENAGAFWILFLGKESR